MTDYPNPPSRPESEQELGSRSEAGDYTPPTTSETPMEPVGVYDRPDRPAGANASLITMAIAVIIIVLVGYLALQFLF